MSRKDKKRPLLEQVEITGYAAEGKCVARPQQHAAADAAAAQPGAAAPQAAGKVLFVPFAAVGDVVDVQVTRSRSSFMEGRIVRMVQPSPVRVEPRCEHFGVCGGCKWQHVPYAEQLRFKQQQVVDALTRIGKVALPECHPIDGSQETFFYRNKLEFTFSPKRWLTFEEVASGVEYDDMHALGFHIPDSFDKVLDIRRCWLQGPAPAAAQDDAGRVGDADGAGTPLCLADRLRLGIKAFSVEHGLPFYDQRQNVGLLRNMVVRTASTGEVMLIVIFGRDDREAIALLLGHVKETFPEVTSLMYVINTKCNDAWSDLPVHCWSGKDHILEEMEGLHFKVGPKSFYQTNSRQAYALYRHARAFAGLTGDELVYDLYTGTGTIANFVARRARRVIGIEYVADAIADARVNSELNGIANTLFYAGDMKDILTADFIREHGRPDVIITDPPRAGMHDDFIGAILFAEPKVIVYVSCNPATQARDLALLDARYRVTDIQPVDMFPHTQHVENVVRLERR